MTVGELGDETALDLPLLSSSTSPPNFTVDDQE